MVNRRIPVLCAVGAIVVAGLVSASGAGAGAAAPPSSPWAQTNGDAAGSRSNRTETTIGAANANKLTYLRSVTAAPLADEQCTRSFVAPALVNGAVYAIAGDQLVKTDAATGATQWRVTLGNPQDSGWESLAVASGLVVIRGEGCISQSDPNEVTLAYRTDTGAPVWSSGDRGFDGQMVVSNGYVATGAEPAESPVEYGVHKLATGAPVWTKTYDNNVCQPDGRVLVVDARVIYTGCNSAGDPDLEARALTSGALAWSLPGDWTAWMGDTDTTAAQHLFATGPDALHDINPKTGAAGPVLSGAGTPLAVGPQRYFATCGAENVCAYSLTTHARDWVAEGFQPVSLAALAHGVLVLDSGEVLNANNGATIGDGVWSSEAGRATTLAIGDGRVAASTDNRILDLYGLPGS